MVSWGFESSIFRQEERLTFAEVASMRTGCDSWKRQQHGIVSIDGTAADC